MKVFVVVGDREQGIYGVFSTEELAEKFTKLMNYKYIMYEVLEKELITSLKFCICSKRDDSLHAIYDTIEEANKDMLELGTRNYEIREL